MKKWITCLLLLMICLLVPAMGFAQTPTSLKCYSGMTLEWTPNEEADLQGYKLYRSDNALDLSSLEGKTPMALVPATAPKVNGMMQHKPNLNMLVAEKTNYFVVSAYDTANNESGPSNVVNCNNNQAPKAPSGLKIE